MPPYFPPPRQHPLAGFLAGFLGAYQPARTARREQRIDDEERKQRAEERRFIRDQQQRQSQIGPTQRLLEAAMQHYPGRRMELMQRYAGLQQQRLPFVEGAGPVPVPEGIANPFAGIDFTGASAEEIDQRQWEERRRLMNADAMALAEKNAKLEGPRNTADFYRSIAPQYENPAEFGPLVGRLEGGEMVPQRGTPGLQYPPGQERFQNLFGPPVAPQMGVQDYLRAAGRPKAQLDAEKAEADRKNRLLIAQERSTSAAQAAGLRQGTAEFKAFTDNYGKALELHGDPKRAFEESMAVVQAARSAFGSGSAPGAPAPAPVPTPQALGPRFPTPKSTQAGLNVQRVAESKATVNYRNRVVANAEQRTKDLKAYQQGQLSLGAWQNRLRQKDIDLRRQIEKDKLNAKQVTAKADPAVQAKIKALDAEIDAIVKERAPLASGLHTADPKLPETQRAIDALFGRADPKTGKRSGGLNDTLDAKRIERQGLVDKLVPKATAAPAKASGGSSPPKSPQEARQRYINHLVGKLKYTPQQAESMANRREWR
jgi:hypothetical protein